MSVATRFRDAIRSYVPPWLSDRYPSPLTVGFRYLWSMIAPLDVAAQVLLEGLQAPWPGAGTPTALTEIGKSRGLVRGVGVSDADYSAQLRGWLDAWRNAGSQLELAKQLHNYIAGRPRVRIVNRAGQWWTVNQDGTTAQNQQAFNWDGTSNPERAGFWSEMWIIVYPDPWAHTPNWGPGSRIWGQTGGQGLGHTVSRVEYDTIRGIIASWKRASTLVRAMIFTSDGTLFDPTNPSSLPDGQWGQWSAGGSGSRVASHRNRTTCRFWEFN